MEQTEDRLVRRVDAIGVENWQESFLAQLEQLYAINEELAEKWEEKLEAQIASKAITYQEAAKTVQKVITDQK